MSIDCLSLDKGFLLYQRSNVDSEAHVLSHLPAGDEGSPMVLSSICWTSQPYQHLS